MENQNRIQASFNKQMDNQEYPNSQLANYITNIQQFKNKPLPYDLQLNSIYNDVFLSDSLIINQYLEDQLNPLQGLQEARNDNQEISLDVNNKDFTDPTDFLNDFFTQEMNDTPYSDFNESQTTEEQINESTNNIIQNHIINLDKEGFQDACEFLEEQKAYDVLEGQSNLLKRAYGKCSDLNTEMTPHKKFKPIQEESNDGSVDDIIASPRVQKPNIIIKLKMNQATKLENLEEVLQIYKKNEVFNFFIIDLNSFVDELISLTIQELEKYKLNTISIDDAIEKLNPFSSSKDHNKRHVLYDSLYENKNTFDFYSTLSKDNRISKYIYCLLTILEDIQSSHLKKYFHLISLSNKILPIINQFFNEDACNMYSKLIELKHLLRQVPNIHYYALIIDRPMLKKYGFFLASLYKTSLCLLSQSICKIEQRKTNDFQTIKYIHNRTFNIETLIMYYREKNRYNHLIDDLRNLTNQIVIEMKKEIFSSEGQCLYKDTNINYIIKEMQTINTIKKKTTKYTKEAQREKMKDLAKENTKEKSFYTTCNPKNRTLNLISTLLGIVEIIDYLDKKILEDKAALEEILENSKTILHYFFDQNSLTNEKIIELKNLLFQISFVQSNRSIFDLAWIKQYKGLIACIYEMSMNSIHRVILFKIDKYPHIK